jgi:Permuted papain-like amidase enzyme, YaeF/YiiX, C92 family
MINTPGKANWLTRWLIEDTTPINAGLCDFSRLRREVKPCDVLLIEGRSRVGEIIKILSQSPWSHSVLYIGKLHHIQDETLRTLATKRVPPEERHLPLVLEALFNEGVVLKPLKKYEGEHIRICRPVGLYADDAQKVMAYALSNLGKKYNTRHIFDLLRYLLPIRLLPRRWLSSLFNPKYGKLHEEICSSMLADAFSSVNFPVRPIIKFLPDHMMELIRRNSKLFTPSDFDYSPYFEIIKYPMYTDKTKPNYRSLRWDPKNRIVNDESEVDEFVD